MTNYNLYDEDEEDYEEEIRRVVKLSIRTMEILIEELEKSNLPQEVKDYMLKNPQITNK